MIHELKILPEYFEAVTKGKKTFELRLNDRNFKVGDYLALNEYNGNYTGRSCVVYVDYILHHEALETGYVILSIKPAFVGRRGEEYYGGVDKFYEVPIISEVTE